MNEIEPANLTQKENIVDFSRCSIESKYFQLNFRTLSRTQLVWLNR